MRLLSTALTLSACLAAASASAQTQTPAQTSSPNVNVISGTGEDGDWTLQRQNEPTIACSSRNPLTCLAGGNDYRSVDIPFPEVGGKVTGDAWVGLYRTTNGGETWTTNLLPGYPQDATPAGTSSPLKAYQAAADPVIRAGSNGLFFYSGIAFNRGEGQASSIFVARLIDNNNQQGTADQPVDFLDTKIVASFPAGAANTPFIDKPWIAVDVPRAGAPMCTVGGPGTRTPLQTFPAGRVYVAWTQFEGVGPTAGKLMFSRSLDCGATWSAPKEIGRIPDPDVNNDGTVTSADQAVVQANIGRRCGQANFNPDADVTGDCVVNVTDLSAVVRALGQTIPAAPRIAQGAAVAIAPTSGALHVVWRQFNNNTGHPNALYAVRSTDGGASFTLPALVGTFNPFEQGDTFTTFRTSALPTLTVDSTGRAYVAVSARGFAPSNPSPLVGDGRIVLSTSTDGLTWSPFFPADNVAAPGHQLMPALASAGNRLQLLYYDLREDLSQLFGPFVDEQPILTGQVPPPPGAQTPIRHTMEVRAAQAATGPTPVFASIRVTQYDVGTLPGSNTAQQLEFNPPNLPLFRLGTFPFMGDYLDVRAAQSVTRGPTGWVLDGPAAADLFHVVWADQRDIRPPADGDWTNYTPPNPPGFERPVQSGFDPGQTVPACEPGQAGMRNQNVYTARLTRGLFTGVVGNAKPVDDIQRGFPIFVQNNTGTVRSYRLTIANQPTGGEASFLQVPVAGQPFPLTTLDVSVPPLSTVARTIFMSSTTPFPRVDTTVQEITAPGGALVTNGQSGTITLNPDPTNPNILNPNFLNPNFLNPNILNAETYNADLENPNFLNPNFINPNFLNPNFLNPNILNPDVESVTTVNPNILNPNFINPNFLNPNFLNPNILNPNILNPNILNTDIVNGSMSDTTWSVTNEGNSAASYTFKLALNTSIPDGFKTQLLAHKVYQTPVVAGCDLKQTTQTVLLANIPNPNFLNPNFLNPNFLNPNILNPAVENLTVALAPGETAQFTLRVVDPNRFDQVTFNPAVEATPAVVAQAANTEDVAAGNTQPPVALPFIAGNVVPGGLTGFAYSTQLTSSVAGTWAVTFGELPQGLTLNTATGEISGTPTEAGTFTFALTFTSASGGFSDSRNYTVTVTGVPAGVDRVWVGTSTNWSDPANWQPNGVPTASDDVYIPGSAAESPTLTAPSTVHDLTLAPGASINSNGQTLTVTGDLEAGNTITGNGTVVLTAGNATLSGSVPNLIISGGDHSLVGPVTVNGNLNIAGPASVALGGFALSITGRLSGSNVPTITGPGPMTVGDVAVTGMTFVNVAFTIDVAPGALMTSFNNVVFSGYAPDVTQLTVTGAGRATPYTFNGLQFQNEPALGFGYYVNAIDTVPIDPNILTVRLVGATPADGSDFTTVSGGAVVEWFLEAQNADIGVTLTDAPDPVTAGQAVTFTFQVTNAGPMPATNVMLTANFGEGFAFQSSEPLCNFSLPCNLGTLEPGGSTTVIATALATTAGTFTSTGAVSADPFDPNGVNNQAFEETTIDAAAATADVSVTITDTPDPVAAGQNVQFAFLVTNSGPSQATNVTLTGNFGAGLTFVSATNGCVLGSPCNLGPLASGASTTVTVTMRADIPGSPVTTGTVSADLADPNETNNSDTETTTIELAAADLRVATTDEPDPVTINGELVYTVTVTNDGPSSATGVALTQTLGAGVTFLSSSPMACDVSAQAAACPIGSLASGASAVVTIRVRATAAGIHNSTSTVQGNESDPNGANNISASTTMVIAFGPCQAGTFGPRVIYPAGTNAEIAGIGDFNEDGVADVVVSNDTGQARGIQLLLGTGGGAFAPPVYFQAGSDGLSVADFDRDGNLDVVTGSEDDDVHVLYGNGAGGFPRVSRFPTGLSQPGGAFAADLTGDGFVDIVIGEDDDTGDVAYLMRNDGAGGLLAPVSLPSGTGVNAIVLDDFNGDGFIDIATSNGDDSTISVLRNNGTGVFTEVSRLPVDSLLGIRPVGDLNGDGRPDIGLARLTTDAIVISAYFNSATGTFTGPVDVGPIFSDLHDIGAADLTGDGFRDLVVYTPSTVQVLRNDGAGSFGPPAVYATSTDPGNLTIGDVSGDGRPDILLTHENAGLGVLLNRCDTQAGSANLSVTMTDSADPVTTGTEFTYTINVTNHGPDVATGVVVNGALPAPSVAFAGMVSGTCTFVGDDAMTCPVGTIAVNGTASIVFRVRAYNSIVTNAATAIGNQVDPDFSDNTASQTTVITPIFSPCGEDGLGGAFASPTFVAAGTNTYMSALGDFNEDGIVDVVVTDASAAGRVALLRGNGNGTFQAPVFVTVGNNPNGIVVADFDEDGNLDFATANQTGNSVSIAYGDGAGGFPSVSNIPVGSINPIGIATADLTGDGNLDLVIGAQAAGSVARLLVGVPASRDFTPQVALPSGQMPREVVLDDYNGDGFIDIVTGNGANATISVLTNNGTGTFTASATLSTSANPRVRRTGDLNSDGRPDIMYTSAFGGGGGAAVSVYLSAPGGGFTGPTEVIPATFGPFHGAVADLNGDGFLDIANVAGGTMLVFAGHGDGSFHFTGNYTHGPSSNTLTIGDVNGDARPDILVARAGAGAIAVFLSRCGAQTGEAELSVVKTDSADPVAVNSPFTYTIAVTNNGPDVATNVVITDSLPTPNIQFVGMVSGICTQAAGTLTCPIGTIPVGETASITMTVRGVNGGTRFNVATAIGDQVDPGFFNNTAFQQTTITAGVATFMVTNTNDSGSGSLRQAIQDANSNTGQRDTIAFNIGGGGAQTITLASALPNITDSIFINGGSQGNPNGTPFIELNGNGVVNTGLVLVGGSSNSTIRGLAINRFTGAGININSASSGNTIESNHIGTDQTGTIARPNGTGISVNSANNLIGGTTAAARNVISGNQGSGVSIQNATASQNLVQGNFIGTTAAGTAPLPNQGVQSGVFLNAGASNNTIGGAVAGAGNVISGNAQHAVTVVGNTSIGNIIQGNFIGTNPAGTAALGNGGIGVDVVSAVQTRIGGAGLARNVISGNGTGIQVRTNASGTIIQGNHIGADAAGTAAIANAGSGISINDNVNGTTIGGAAVGQANIIAFNGGVGLSIQSGTGNIIVRNSIFSNGGLGIDLGADGITANDAADGDSGANNLQNFPVLTSATLNGSQTSIQGTLNSTAQTQFTIEFFDNTVCDGLGNGEGRTLLGLTNVTTGADGNASFSVTLGSSTIVTATATDPNGNTSEFSACRTTTGSGPQTFTVVNTNDSGAGSLRQAILDANANVGQTDNIHFNIPGAGPHVIPVPSVLPELTDPVAIDATTQTGFGGVPLVQLSAVAGGGGSGIQINAGGSVVRGLSITGFSSSAISIITNGGNVIEANYIGVTPAGVAAGNLIGVAINNASGNRIGSTSTTGRNVISSNSAGGILIAGAGSTNNTIVGNFIGLDPAGAAARPNLGGVIIQNGASNNVVGGTAAGSMNIISGSSGTSNGVTLASGPGNLVQGNRIGTNALGTGAVPNGGAGVFITAGLNTVGGAVAGAGNLISGNTGSGIRVDGVAAGSTNIQGNHIGFNSAVSAALPNNPGIQITGGASGTMIGGTSAVARNVISGNTNGIIVSGSPNTIVEGNFIGTNLAGTAGLPNAGQGVVLQSSTTGSRVGGVAAGAGNVISANAGAGILIATASSSNLVQGNFIGTDVTGSVDLGNVQSGIHLAASGNTVGGTTVSARNIISGNNGHGIIIDGVSGTLVQGNYIGTSAAGTAALANTLYGVSISGASNTIGGTAAGAENVISANGLAGVGVGGASATGNVVEGNRIGTNAAGTASLGNGFSGVEIGGGASANRVGGTSTAARNIISGNVSSGIVVAGSGTVSNRVSGNSVSGNGGVGIDLGLFDGVTPNDPGDGDAGPNNLQNFPVLTSATTAGGVVSVNGSLNSTANTTFTIELFANAACDSSGNGEGAAFVGTLDVTTDGTGNIAFTTEVPVVAGSAVLTATATDPNGNTSEFSACRTATSSGPQTFTVTSAADSGPGTLRQAMIDANANTGIDTIRFNIPGAGPHTIDLLSELPNTAFGGFGVVIDGTTQPGYAGLPVIELNGAAAGPDARGLVIGTGNSTIRGLAINRFGTGGATIDNGLGFGAGIFLGGQGGSVVEACFIGTDPTGTIARPNRTDGIVVQSAGNVIGPNRNVISANGRHGIFLTAPAGDLNTIQGNYIGVDQTGTVDLGNAVSGISSSGATDNNYLGNVISGNNASGISISGTGSESTIQANFIGTSAGGTSSVPNGTLGILISSGEVTVTSNTIAFNPVGGIRVTSGTGNALIFNSIHSNGGLGIDLGTDAAVTPNDPGDADIGANNLQNFPVLTSATAGPASTTITGTLNSTPNTTFQLHFYLNESCDPSGFGEGQVFAGVANVTTNASGSVSFSTVVGGGLSGFVSATATSPGLDTSEFSACRFVTPAGAGARIYLAHAISPNGVVSVIDTATSSVPTTIAVGNTAQDVAFLPDGSRAYVGNFFSGNTSVIDTATNTVIGTIAGGLPIRLVMNPAGTRLYIVNGAGTGSVLVVNTATNTVVATIPFAANTNPLGAAITPDGTRLFVANRTSNDVFVIDTTTNTLLAPIPVGNTTTGVATSLDGSRVYVSSSAGGTVVVINTATNAVVTTIATGAGASWMAIKPDGSEVYVSGSSGISRIDTATNTVIGSIAQPNSGAIVFESNERAYVVSGSFVRVLDTATNTVIGSIGTPASPNGMALVRLIAASGTNFTVTNVLDNGPGSLRQAITDANANRNVASRDVIGFDIPGSGPHTISPASPLPAITDPVIIDGTTEPDFAGTPMVELDGTNAGGTTNGLFISAGNTVVRGLVVNRFGTNGPVSQPPASDGGAGISLPGLGNNVIEFNYVGTDVTGTVARPNRTDGVWMNGPANRIGGSLPTQRNVISANGWRGIVVSGSASNVVQGNFVGTDASGTADLGNGISGIEVFNGTQNAVGGVFIQGEGNVVSGNALNGILISGGSANRVLGNKIGTDVFGTGAVPNGDAGLAISSSSNIVGNGLGPNTIAFNAQHGISVTSGTGNVLSLNAVFDNGGLGINLGTNGVTQNDTNDVDAGANGLQNFPVLTRAELNGATLELDVTLNSIANRQYTIEYFQSPTCDVSGFGEGQTAIGVSQLNVGAINTTNLTVPFAIGSFAVANFITATATSPDGTSEFSNCIEITLPQATADVQVSLADNPDPVLVGQNVDYIFAVTNHGPDPATNVTLNGAYGNGLFPISATPPCQFGNLCNLGTLAPGATATITATLRADLAGGGGAFASVTADQSDPNLGNNTDAEETTVNEPVAINFNWTGAVSTDWTTPGNWNPAGPPGSIDNVTIPAGTTNQPAMNTAVTVHNLVVQPGATLTNADPGALTVTGNLNAGNTINGGPVILAGTGTVTGAVLGDVQVTGNYTATGTFTVGDDMEVFGTFDVGGATVSTDDFSTLNTGVLRMPNAAGTLTVNDADFEGGQSLLVAGTLRIESDLEQLSGTTASALLAAPNHTTVFFGADTQIVSIQGSPSSSLGRVVIEKSADTIQLLTNVVFNGPLVIPSTSVATFVGNGGQRFISAFGGGDINGPTFDNVRLMLAEGSPPGTIARFDNATFQNMALDTVQLQIQGDGTFTFENVRFLTTPTTGLYIQAIDTTPGTDPPLVINMRNAQPVNGSARTQVLNGAVVNWGDMTLQLATPLLGINRSMSATVTLAQPAPAGGRVVSLASSDTGVATVTPPSITVPQGQTIAEFTVNGITSGTVTLTASSTGLQSTSRTLTVTAESLISLGTGLEIAPGQSGGVALSIGVPAPAGGLHITLASSDPQIATVTPEIIIPEGLQIPATNPVVTGHAAGLVQISATAPGFAPDIVDVNVTLTLTFSPANFSVVDDATRGITLNLSAPAPPGGLLVGLATDNTNIATVPSSVSVPAGFLNFNVPVTGVAIGQTTLRTSVPGIAQATATINVTAPPTLTVPDQTIGRDLQGQTAVGLSAAAPPGGLEVTVTSPDPARVMLSANAATIGTASIVLNVQGGQFATPNFHVQGLQDNGTVNVTVTAAGYTGDTVVVTLTPSGFIINSPGSISTNTRAGNTNVQITAARLHPTTLAWQANQALRGGLTVNVPVTATGTAGTITTSPLTFTGGVGVLNTAFDPVEEGSSTITVGVPAGFSTPANSRQITATVTAPAISFTNNTIGKDLQVQASASLGAAALAGGTTVTVTSNTPSLLLLSTNPAVEGTATLELAVPAGSSNIPTFHIQALAGAGTATVTASAPGYATATATFTLTPSGFIINSPGAINTTSFALNTTIQITSARLNPSGLAWQANQALRGGLSASVDVTSSNTNVGTITVSPLNFTNGNGIVNTAFDPANAGTTQISVGTPAGFSTPSTDRTLNATVTAPNVIASPVTVGRDLQAQTTVSLQNAPPAPVTITLTVNNPQNVTLTTDPLVAGSSSLTFPNISNTNGQTFFVQGRLLGSTTLTASAPGFNPITVSIDVHPSGFIVNSPSSISTNTFAANTNVQVASARLHPTTLAWQANQPLRGGMPTVNVPVTSSDVNVGTITISPLQFGPTVQAQSTQFDPRASGTTQIAVGVPAGFDTPSTDRTILATVTAPGVTANSATVGRDLQTSVGITLGVTPPSPVNVTVTSNAPTLTTLSLDPLVAGGASVTFNNVTTTNVGTVFVQGRALGSTTLTVQAAGYNDATPVITIDPSGFIVNSPSSLTTTTFAANTNVQIASARLHPTTLAWQANQPLRGGMPTVNVSLTNQNDAVGVLTLTSLLFGPNVGTQNTAFDPIAPGTTVVSVVPPAGFSTPSTDRQMPVTVTAPPINLGGDANVGRDLQISRSVTLQNAPPSPVAVTLTVANPAIATITTNPSLIGSDVQVFTGVTTTTAGTLYVQGRAQGTTTITATAQGYITDVITVEVRPSGFIINSPPSITTTAGAANTNIQVTPAMLDPLTLNWQANQALRGGLSVGVTVTSSNTAAGTITVSPVGFTANATTGATAFDPAGVGVSTIAVVPPAGFDTPSSDRTIVATVNP